MTAFLKIKNRIFILWHTSERFTGANFDDYGHPFQEKPDEYWFGITVLKGSGNNMANNGETTEVKSHFSN